MKKLFSKKMLAAIIGVIGTVGVVFAATTIHVNCTGQGVRPARMVVTPTLLAFGDVDSGAVVTKTFTIENRGGRQLTGKVQKTANCGADYEVMSNGVPVTSFVFSIPPGGSTVATIRFKPMSIGSQVCDIYVGE